MKIADLFRFSTDNLRRRKGRTALTVIGVVVGVCAIIVMVSLGIAVRKNTDEMLQNWGDLTKITVYSWGAQQGTPALDDTMVAQLKGMEHVSAATPIYHSNTLQGNVYDGKNQRYQSYSQLIGMDADSIEPMGYELLSGSYLTGQSLGKNKIPVLVELQAPFNFEDTKKSYQNPNRYIYPEYDDPMSNTPSNAPQFDENGKITNASNFFFDPTGNYTYRMVYGTNDDGTDKYRDYELVPVGFINAGSDYSISGGFIMSIADIQRLEQEYKKLSKTSGGGSSGGGVMVMSGGYYGGDGGENAGGYDSVNVKVDNVDNTAAVEQQIKDIGYQINSMSEIRTQMQGQVAQTQMMLGSLAAVSLFVAALNIANTMTMAIYERTREIGVMKVLGCRLKDIRSLFLIESGAIGLLGGVIGSAVSVLLSFVINHLPQIMLWLGLEGDIDIAGLFGLSGMMQNMPDAQLSIVPMWLILLALGFSTTVGLLSGIAPANRAVNISSLEAIRHE